MRLHTIARAPKMGPGTPTMVGEIPFCAALGPRMAVERSMTSGPARVKASAMMLRVVMEASSASTRPRAKPHRAHPSVGVGVACHR